MFSTVVDYYVLWTTVFNAGVHHCASWTTVDCGLQFTTACCGLRCLILLFNTVHCGLLWTRV